MSPLDRVHKVEAEKAREVLAPFRVPPGHKDKADLGYGGWGSIVIGIESADRLQTAICEALVEAYNRGQQSRSS